MACGGRFTSRERLDLSYLSVIKNNGQKEPFRREKILLGMIKSFGKNQIPEEKLEAAVEEILQKIHRLGVSEIKSSLIGDLVLEKLYKLDLVAYVRFASVFKDFKDVASLRKELEMLEKGESG